MPDLLPWHLGVNSELYSLTDIAEADFYRTVLSSIRPKYTENYHWKVNPPNLDESRFTEYSLRVCYSKENMDSRTVGVDFYGAAFASLVFDSGSKTLSVSVISEKKNAARETMDSIRKLFPKREHIAIPDDTTDVTFCFSTPKEIAEIERSLEAPDWAHIRYNYPVEIREDIESLFSPPESPGRLILWSGMPGTGKTWAIRSLVKTIYPWCESSYVIDPDQVLGGRSDQLISLLLGSRPKKAASYASRLDEIVKEEEKESTDDFRQDFSNTFQSLEARESQKWKLLILEDSGELISATAKSDTGQALSRLLNIVDGMLGQGLNLMVLITTNEELSNLHPAIVRPGRCLANTKFRPLSISEAKEWLTLQGKPSVKLPNKPVTLATLYSTVSGHGPKEDHHSPVGFL